MSNLGPPVPDPVRIEEPALIKEGGTIVGQVVALDRFGNLLTNLPGDSVDEGNDVEIEGRLIPVVRTYGDVPSGAVAALVNSDGQVEMAANERSAAELLKAKVGTRVRVLSLGDAS